MMDKETIILFAKGDISKWDGLPANLPAADLIKLFGNIIEAPATTVLGYYPADRVVLMEESSFEKLIVFTREGIVVMIECLHLPDASILQQLPQPDEALPNEILINGAYPAEYIYSNIGLNLTVAKHFDNTIPDSIVRCRGFQRLNNAREFDTRYYRAFEDQEVY
jgi:hypothetical protein